MNEFAKYVPTEAEMQLAEKSMSEEQSKMSAMHEIVAETAEILEAESANFATEMFITDPDALYSMNADEVKKYVQEVFDYLTHVGKDSSTVDAGKVLGHNLPCMNVDAAFALGEAMGATENDWKYAISEYWDFRAEFCEIILADVEKLNVICRKIGLPEVTPDDKKIKEIIFLEIVDGRYEDSRILGKLCEFDMGLISFLQAFNNTKNEDFEEYKRVSYIMDLFVAEYCLDLKSIDEIEDRLLELDLVDNAIINIGNIDAELNYQLQWRGDCFNEFSGSDFAMYLSIQRILGTLDLKADWVKRIAQTLREGYAADQARSALEEQGFNLDQLAGADKTVMLEVDQESLEDMFGE